MPAYTPELNPAELCFNFIKHQVRKSKPQTYEELELAIENTLELLNEKDMTKYFNCFEYFSYKQKAEKGYIEITSEEEKEKWGLFFKEQLILF